MTRKRRSFTPEFKQEAASLVLDQGYTIAQASTSLGVGESALRRWVQQLTDEREGIFSDVLTGPRRADLPRLPCTDFFLRSD